MSTVHTIKALRLWHVQDNLGHNALLEATKRGHDSLIRLLIDNDAK